MDFERSDVKVKFNENSGQYDGQRKKLIPCFDDFYSIAISLAEANDNNPNVLDVGAGTGLLSFLILKKFPNANLTLIDISEKMLEVAKVRFKGNLNVTYINDDYTNYKFNEKYDVIISSLSIHHLTEDEKKQLYRNIYACLNENGVFINADQVLGETPFIESLYKRDWKYKVENSGLSKEEILSAYERVKLDKMSTLDDQINWLKGIGFTDVDCVYKYFNFVVIYGRK
ncbi:class I SAM-dependent methyltransferase [Desulfosporosinus nitroreducens]|uniref:Methyltransferase domain-containing protein n=1 Tax=Desulfosporosinus nitroreducens TaxID=2018668 RepID=A0ABT8QUN4_9FIRM|nr:class I SAM-dependent methyltransferase [Desulfosporosinus nitroreducens]MDO0824164.1 methyltransferase domain-containing protein [Desulfosporosinus nitroreducens]